MTKGESFRAIAELCIAIIDAVKAGGNQGTPGGHLYATMMASGCSLEQFEKIMGLCVQSGKIRKSGDLYYPI